MQAENDKLLAEQQEAARLKALQEETESADEKLERERLEQLEKEQDQIEQDNKRKKREEAARKAQARKEERKRNGNNADSHWQNYPVGSQPEHLRAAGCCVCSSNHMRLMSKRATKQKRIKPIHFVIDSGNQPKVTCCDPGCYQPNRPHFLTDRTEIENSDSIAMDCYSEAAKSSINLAIKDMFQEKQSLPLFVTKLLIPGESVSCLVLGAGSAVEQMTITVWQQQPWWKKEFGSVRFIMIEFDELARKKGTQLMEVLQRKYDIPDEVN